MASPVTAKNSIRRTRVVALLVLFGGAWLGMPRQSMSQQAAGSGLVAAYSFDEGSGSTVADSSGLGHHGIIREAAWTTGKTGNALSFDGVNDWVTVTDSSALDLTTAVTLEAWVNPSVVSGWRAAIYKERDVYYLYAATPDTRPMLGSNIGGYRELSGSGALPLNTWTHVAGTYDGTTQRLYVNGVSVAQRAQTGLIGVDSGSLRLGGNATFGEFFGGLLDDVRIYGRALSAAEIRADMNTPVGGTTAPSPPTCTPNWQCDAAWSVCVNGSQARTCIDTNSCDVNTNKPSESQACSVASANLAPSASAGLDQVVILPAAASLSGTASDDGLPVGSSLTVNWSKSSGPGMVMLGNAAARTTTATFDAAGVYVLRFTATDGSLTTSDELTVTVNAQSQSNNGTAATLTSHSIPVLFPVPSVVSARSGNWSDPATWAPAGVPGAGADVHVLSGHIVTYDVSSTAALRSLSIFGTLGFSRTVDTKLHVGYTLVHPGGYLQIGTPADPIPVGRRAEIVIADQSIDLTRDPLQWGTGINVLGRVDIAGAPLSKTFVRLTREPRAGDTTLTLAEAVTGWQPGDRLILPDTRRVDYDMRTGQWGNPPFSYFIDDVKIASISGATVTLQSALKYDHFASYLGKRGAGGVPEFYPHVVNLTRNIVVRSANPAGTRGQVSFLERARVDVRYAEFIDLGRTRGEVPLGDPDPTRPGYSNQVGRYPVHLHHLKGPLASDPDKPQYQGANYQAILLGNSTHHEVSNPPKGWYTIHQTHYSLIQDNVGYNAHGVGYYFEDGSERENIVKGNIGIRVNGHAGRVDSDQNNPATDGTIFYFKGPMNRVIDNVAANANAYGMIFFFKYAGKWFAPPMPGAEYTQQYDLNATPLTEVRGNEAYGAMVNGMAVWWLNLFGSPSYSQPTASMSVVKDFTVWHVQDYGVFNYEVQGLTWDHPVIRGDETRPGNVGMYFADYYQINSRILNPDIQGVTTGILKPFITSFAGEVGVTTIEGTGGGCLFKNKVNVATYTPWHNSGGAGARTPSQLVVRNCKFAYSSVGPASEQYHLYRQVVARDVSNYAALDSLVVYDFNQVAGDNFAVYYEEQNPAAIMPASSGNIVGSPEAGLTNQQAWTKYGVALAGAVAPCTTARTGIEGYACALSGATPPPVVAPTVSITSPTAGAAITGTSVTVNFATSGDRTQADHLHAQLDELPEVRGIAFDGSHTFTNVAAGSHTVRVYLAKADHTALTNAGASASVVFTAQAATCISIWACPTTWSACVNGSQTRVCTDANSCAAPRTETQSCLATPPPSTAFAINDRVRTTENLNVRSTAELAGALLGTQAQGSLGTVIGGPTFVNASWWWRVNYDNAPDGWSIENYLARARVLKNGDLLKLTTDTRVYLIENNTRRWIVDAYTFRTLGYTDSQILIVTQAELDQFPPGANLQLVCTPNWNCTAWSSCTAAGSQTRTCTDANSCGVTTNKPAGTGSCTAETVVANVSVTRVGTHAVPESSGVVASRANPGVYWMIPDSGNPATLYAVGANGATVRTYPVAGASNVDWEDIAIDEANNLWIADVGDNAQSRTSYILYKVAEPNPSQAGTVTATAYRFVYPDGKKDAEGVFVWQGVPYVVQKRPANASVYRFPEVNAARTVTLELVGEFTNGGNWITGADISADGRRLALINDGADYHWVLERAAGSTSVTDFFTAPTRRWRMAFTNNQGEAITFSPTGYDVYVASETGDFWRIARAAYDTGAPAGDGTPPTASNGAPSGVLPAGTTAATLTFATSEAATCRYATSPNIAYAAMATTFVTTGSTSHATAVSGLTDGSLAAYYIRCTDVAGNAMAADYAITFQVAAAPSSGTRFAVIGDYGWSGAAERDVANLVKGWNPDFVLTTGDNNYDNGAAATIDANIGQYYRDFIAPYTGSYGSGATTNRFFPSLGNHDWSTPGAAPYLAYFTLPGNERYYDFVRGPVHFFALDSDTAEPDGITSTSVQGRWLEAKLKASTAPLQVVYFHHSPYSSGAVHGSTPALQWPFKDWGADLVVTGHEHAYERLSAGGLTYLVVGTGGKSLYQFGTPVAGSQLRYSSDYGALRVDVDDTAATVRFITRAGVTVDSFTLPLPSAPSCTPNWSCAAFSACVNATQTRTCTDLNRCGTTADKPLERQGCVATPPAAGGAGGVAFRPHVEGRSSAASLTFSLRFLDPATLEELAQFSAVPAGTIALPPTVRLEPRPYIVVVSVPGYLRRKATVTIVANATIDLPELSAGDFNGDNLVNTLDWSGVNARWFSTDAAADFNGDGVVNSLDFSSLNRNWNRQGE